MPLVDGDRPAEGDVWFRILTNKDYLARGRVNHGAFKGSFMGAAGPGRSWDAEASGRLRSLTGSKQETHHHALQYCKDHNNSFHGYMILDPNKPPIEGVIFQNLKLGVRYTPIIGVDTAHADLTFTGTIPADKSDEQKKLFLALPEFFIAIHDNGWFLLPDATIAPPSPVQPAEQSVVQPPAESRVSLLKYIKRFRDFILKR
jgi:hypothetical protein